MSRRARRTRRSVMGRLIISSFGATIDDMGRPKSNGFVESLLPPDLPGQVVEILVALRRIAANLDSLIKLLTPGPPAVQMRPYDYFIDSALGQTYIATSVNLHVTQVIISVDTLTKVTITVGGTNWFSAYMAANMPFQFRFPLQGDESKEIGRGLQISYTSSAGGANVSIYVRGVG